MQPYLCYQNGDLYLEEVCLRELALSYGTPCYVYSETVLKENWQAFHRGWGKQPHLVCFAVKANSNLAVLRTLSALGSGFDVVSAGELTRVIKAGGDPQKTIFSGVGKRDEELRAGLESEIKCFNVESATELTQLNRIAESMHRKAPVALRINPDISAGSHPYLATGLYRTKFGIAACDAISCYQEAARLPCIDPIGISCHIGSQITELSPFSLALTKVLDLYRELRTLGIHLKYIDIGGGLGVSYQKEAAPKISAYVSTLHTALSEEAAVELIMEPGRRICAAAGVLLTRIEHIKQNTGHNFAIVDAGMNDFIRPALYSSWHGILPLQERLDVATKTYDVVGPVCETGDYLAKKHTLAILPGDLLAVTGAGAYGFVMSSNYNSRPRACEIMVTKEKTRLIRRRESIEQLMENELLLD